MGRATLIDVQDAVDRLTPDVVCIDSPPAWANTAVADPPSVSFANSASRHSQHRLTPGHIPSTVGCGSASRSSQRSPTAIRDSAGRGAGHRRRGLSRSIRRPPRRAAPTEQRIEGPLPPTRPRGSERRLLRTPLGRRPRRRVAGLTGIQALAGASAAVGDPDEGVIVLPIERLPHVPLRRDDSQEPASPTSSPARVQDGPAVERLCLCGCGAAVRNRFLPGHDAKLKSQLRRRRKDGQAATEQLRELGWLENLDPDPRAGVRDADRARRTSVARHRSASSFRRVWATASVTPGLPCLYKGGREVRAMSGGAAGCRSARPSGATVLRGGDGDCSASRYRHAWYRKERQWRKQP